MRWGISTLIGHKKSLASCCREAAALGYQCIELNCVRDYYAHCNALQLADSPEELDNINNLLRGNNLKCSAVDCHGLFGRNKAEVFYTLEYLNAGFRIARYLGAPAVITSIPGGGADFPDMITMTRELCRKAAAENLNLNIEAEYGFAVGPGNLKEFLDAVGAENLKVNFDPSHFVRSGRKVEEAIQNFFDRISHVHLKEYLPEIQHGTRYTGAPGTPCSRMLDELLHLGYNGVVSAETSVELDEDKSENPAESIMSGINKWLESKGLEVIGRHELCAI